MRHSRKQLKMSKICAFSPILTKKGCFYISASMTRSNKQISLAKSACFCVLQSLLGEISNREHAFAFQLTLHCKKLSKYISQPVPTTGHNPDRYKWISLGYLFGSVQDNILLPNNYPCRSKPISSVCKLGCGILFVLGLFFVQISLLVPV